MTTYLAFVFIPLIFGLIDYLLKGSKKWETVPPFMRGWGWHIGFALPYVAIVVLIAYAMKSWWLLGGVLGVANEDLFFYIFSSIKHKKLMWNNWLFSKEETYFVAVFVANVAMVLFTFLSIL